MTARTVWCESVKLQSADYIKPQAITQAPLLSPLISTLFFPLPVPLTTTSTHSQIMTPVVIHPTTILTHHSYSETHSSPHFKQQCHEFHHHKSSVYVHGRHHTTSTRFHCCKDMQTGVCVTQTRIMLLKEEADESQSPLSLKAKERLLTAGVVLCVVPCAMLSQTIPPNSWHT